jgi:DNA-directed RNA polymerase subunit E'/Rpb7
MTENKEIIYGVYLKSILTTKIYLHISEMGRELDKKITQKLIFNVSNKCIQEGYVSPDNMKVISRSSGIINTDYVMFHVVYECDIAHPVEGMIISSKVKTLTKAGIHAQVVDKNGNMPVTIFVARDHNLNMNVFRDVKEGDNIDVKVIGIRYELNDPYVSVIATLIKKSSNHAYMNKKMDGGCVNNENDNMNESESDLLEF